MSAVRTQSVTAQQDKPSAATLLAGATKSKTTNHLVYPGEAGRESASRWLELNTQLAETERELALVRDQVLEVVRPWYEETCARRRAHDSTVVVESPAGSLRISFQHRYTKLPAEREPELRSALGDDFDRFMKPMCSLKLRKRSPKTLRRSKRW